MQKICTESDTFLIIPTAASNEVTRARCHPLVFRTSHSNWQITSPAGEWLFKKGKKRVITMGMNYAAGREEIEAFVEMFKAAGGQVLDQKWPGIRELDYQAYFADVLPKQPDAVSPKPCRSVDSRSAAFGAGADDGHHRRPRYRHWSAVGAFLLVELIDQSAELTEHWKLIVGVVVIAVTLFARGGLVGLALALRTRMFGLRASA